jgi:HK97 gp10 family phage protein
MMNFKIEGLEDLKKALNALPVEIQQRSLRSAVSAGAKVVVDAAISKAPSGDTGNLKKSIYRYRSRSQSGTGRETYYVGVRKGKKAYADTARNRRLGRVGKKYTVQGEAYYWRFLEFGTAKMGAKPFMRPAFESSKGKILDIMKQRLGKSIQDQARKLAKK